MASEEPAIEVADFEFHALRKVRLSSVPVTGDISKRLALSSSYGIGIAIVASNRLLSFHTDDVQAQKATRTNINEEVTGLRTRTTNYFDAKASLLSISCNSDGSLVGVMADTAAGPMVHVFDAAAFSLDYQGHISPICAVRVSADAGASARCFEWSPAAADTLVAAASDRACMTVVVKGDSSGYSVVAEKKLGAAVRCISWSRKGKQLVVGDDLGKVVQMKPELDMVRSTMPPDSCTIPNAAVVGLCWMTTTEFLVVYGAAASKDLQATIMVTKKDKPVTWSELPDISYGSPHSGLPPAMSALCLLEWNLVLSLSTRSSEVGVVGKAAEQWQVWIPDELYQAALPTNAASAETFPVGADLDFSARDELVLSDDGQKRAAAAPILCVLTSDGLLMSYHAVNSKPGAPSVQVPRKPVNLAAIRVGGKPEGAGGQTAAAEAAAAPAAAAAAVPAAPTTTPTVKTSIFGTPATAPAAAAAATTPAAKTSLFGAAPAAAAAAAQPSTAALFASLEQTPICSPSVRPAAATSAAAGGLFGAAAAAPTAPAAQQAAAAAAAVSNTEAQEAAERAKKEAEKQKKLVEERTKVNVLLQEVQNEATALVDEMARMRTIVHETRPTFDQMDRQMREEATGKMHEMDGYVHELEEMQRRQERMLKVTCLRVADRLKMVEEAGEGRGALAALRSDYDYDREETMSQVRRRVAAARTTLAEVQKELQRLRGSKATRSYESDAKWTSDREQTVHAAIRNIQQVVRCQREKVEDVEALVRNVTYLKLSDETARKEQACFDRDESKKDKEEVKIVTIKRAAPSSSSAYDSKQRTPEELAAARMRLLTAKSLFPHAAPRRFVPDNELQHESAAAAAAASSESFIMAKTSHNQSLHAGSTVVLHSPLRAQLEERLLEVTKPRKAIQLPNLEKFAIKQESRPAALREPPSPIRPVAAAAAPAAAAAKPAAAAASSSIFSGAAAPAFRLPEPQASSTPNKPPAAPAAPAAASSSSAASLFGKPAAPVAAAAPAAAPAAAAATPNLFLAPIAKTPEKSEEKKKDEDEEEAGKRKKATVPAEPTAPAAPAAAYPATPATTTSSILGGGSAAAAAAPAAPAPPEPAKPSIFGTPATTSSIFGGGTKSPATPAAAAAAATEEKKKEEEKAPTLSMFGSPAAPAAAAAATPVAKPAASSIFGGGVSSPAAPTSSPFGAAAAATSPTSSSIFGGGVSQPPQQTSSPFGAAFGKPAAAAPSAAATFSFKAAASAAASEPAQQKPSAFGSFGQSAAASQPAAAAPSAFGSIFGGGAAAKPPAANSFAAAAMAAAADDGMEDGGTASSGFGGAAAGGGGGFMGGLGSATSANAGRNVFGGGFGAAPAAQAAPSIFGNKSSTTSSFGAAKPSTFGSPSIFGGGAGGSTSSAFGGATSSPQQQPAQTSSFGSPSSGFGGKPAFGSGPSFGAKSVFGAPAAAPANSNAFGGGAAASGGFASFANQGGGFGSVAAAQQQQTSSIFGGGVAQAKPAGASSIFGGGSSSGTTSKFSSWR